MFPLNIKIPVISITRATVSLEHLKFCLEMSPDIMDKIAVLTMVLIMIIRGDLTKFSLLILLVSLLLNRPSQALELKSILPLMLALTGFKEIRI